jgi:hypothetical protein
MATNQERAEKYAKWLISNKDKQGSSEWDTVSSAYRELRSSMQSDEPKKERGVIAMLRENIFGEGEVDTFGERVGEAIEAAGAGALRGVRGALELPEMIGSLGRAGYQYATGQEVDPLPQKTVAGEAFTKGYEKVASAVGADPSELEFRGETGTGKFAGKVGEFLPFAGRRVAQYAAAPVVAGMAGEKGAEFLGFGETGQTVGEIAGMLAGPAAYGGAVRAAGRAISPYGGADDARLAAAKTLEEKGVSVTAGQKVGSEALRRKEAMTSQGEVVRDKQLEEFTAAAMKEIGSTSKRATADALQEAQARIGGQINSALQGVSLRPNVTELMGFSDAAAFYRKVKPTGQEAKEAGDIFNKINKAFVKAARQDGAIDVDQYRAFRSQLSKGTISTSEPIRETSKRMLTVLDDAMDRALTGLGRQDDIGKLNQARSQYRDYLAVERSVAKGGEAASAGLITPAALGSALRSQGKRAYVQERRGDIGDLARAGEQVAVFPRTSGTAENLNQIVGGLRSALISGSAGGAVAALAGLPPWVGATVAAVGPTTFNRLIMTQTGQKYLANQMVKNSQGTITPEYARGIVATLAAQLKTEPQGS